MLMPFGKYKSQPLEELPSEYLSWLAGIDLREPLLSAVREEVTRRTEQGEELPFSPSAQPSQEKTHSAPSRAPKKMRSSNNGGGAWTMGGDPQEIIRGDFPVSSRRRKDDDDLF